MSEKIDSILVKALDPDVIEVTAAGWEGRVLKMTRRAFTQRHYEDRPAAYILYADHFNKAELGREIYIGHTSSAGGRLTKHDAEKDFWTMVLVFTSLEGWMNTAYTQNLEHSFIDLAKRANRYEVKNATNGAATHLGPEDEKRLEAFLAGVPDVLRLAGIDVFDWNRDGVYTSEENTWRGTCTSRVRIEATKPLQVRVLAGSEIYGLDRGQVTAADLPGVAYVDENQVHRFDQDAVVPISGPDFLPRLLGKHTKRWTSESGKKLSDMLKKLDS